MIDTKELRRLAQAATHPTTKGRWIRLFGERTVYDRMEDGCRGVPIVAADHHPPGQQEAAYLDFIAAANPAAISELLDRIEAAKQAAQDYLQIDGEKARIAQLLEAAEKNLSCCQAEREEAAELFLSVKTKLLAERDELLSRLEAAEKERDDVARQLVQSEQGKCKISEECDTYKAAYNEWIAKTEWMQDELTCGKLPAKYLGMHRADGIKAEIDALRAELSKQQSLTDAAQHIAEVAQSRANRLQARIEAMERQEPAGTLHDDGYFVWRERPHPHQSNYAGWKMALYALPGAKGE